MCLVFEITWYLFSFWIKKGYEIKFKSGIVIISKGETLMKAVRTDNMYLLRVDNNKVYIYDYLNVSIDKSYLWHIWLGHINKY